MKSLRPLCWIWIVAATLMILYSAPISVTRESYTSSGFQVTRIEWIGPFKQPYSASKSSVDFSRPIVVLFTANFLPALVLWKHDEVVRWLDTQRHPSDEVKARIARNRQRGLAFAKTVLVAFLVLVGVGIYKVIVNSPPESNPATAPATPVTSGATLPPALVIDPTPTPVRRAIPVNQ